MPVVVTATPTEHPPAVERLLVECEALFGCCVE
jgi:hypothetical protein